MLSTIKTRFFSKDDLKTKAVLASIWTILGFGGQKFLQLGSNLILTRILFPEVFGLMAIISVIHTGIQMLSDIGIKPALVQHRNGDDNTFINTAWTMQIIRGFILTGAICILAWPLSLLYDQPLLLPLLLATSVTPMIEGFQSIGLATAERHLKQGKVTLITFSSQLITISSTVVLAIYLKSVWALAYGLILGAIFHLIIGYIVLGQHKHKLTLDRSSATDIFKFGKWIFWGTLFTYIGGSGLKGIQGVFVSATTLGLIHLAGMISWAVGQLIGQFLSKVIFPVLSHVERDDPETFKKTLSNIRVKLLVICLPAFCLISLSSQWIVDILYDDRYTLAGTVLAIMAISGALSSLPMLYQNALLAQGNSKLHFHIMTTATTLRVLGVFIGYQVWGTLGMLLSTPITSCLTYFIVSFFAYRKGWLDLKADIAALIIVAITTFISFSINIDFSTTF